MGQNQFMPQLLKSRAFRKSDQMWHEVVGQDRWDNMLRIKIDFEASDWLPYSHFKEIVHEIVERG